MKRKLTLAALLADNAGPAFHHLIMPCKYFEVYDLFKVIISDDLRKILQEEADIYLFQRQYNGLILSLIKVLKRKGKVIVHLCDDNVWDLLPSNPAYSEFIKAKKINTYNDILVASHALLCTMPIIKDRAKQFNNNVFIVRNLIDSKWGTYVCEGKDNFEKDTVRILWTGTPHHKDDINHLKFFFREATKRYQNIRWIFFGYISKEIKSILPEGSYEYYRFVDPNRYYMVLGNLDADLGIAPLIDNNFNAGRTPLKFHEYSLMGIPSLLSPVGPYTGIAKRKLSLPLFDNTTNKWLESLEKFLNMSYEEQRNLTLRAHKWVIENHDYHIWIFERAALLYHIYNMITGEGLDLPTDIHGNSNWDFSLADKVQYMGEL